MWSTRFKKTWEKYAEIHGYDIVVIDDYIDVSEKGKSRSPHWQKCLILEHPKVKKFDDVVWIDSDILINYHTAPCIVEHNASGKIGAVTQGDRFPNREKIDNVLMRMRSGTPAEWMRDNPAITYPEMYMRAGLAGDINDVINTGVLVLKPERHAALMRRVYDEGVENRFSAKENMPLSYRLLKDGMVNPLDIRFNKLWDEAYFEAYPFFKVENFRADQRMAALCVNMAFQNAYFLHFLAGDTRKFIGLVNPELQGRDTWVQIFQFFEQQKAQAPQ